LLSQLDSYCHRSIEKVILTFNIPEADRTIGNLYRFKLERIHNASPKGFGANHNSAFDLCRSPWFLVLNPDVRLFADVLGEAARLADSKAGVLAPRIFEPGKVCAEQHRSLLTPMEILKRRLPGYVVPSHPDWIPGLFMLFNRDACTSLAGFNSTRYFMYGEDMDICARLQLAGWQLEITEHLSVQHDARRSSHVSLAYLRWHIFSLVKWWLSPVFWRFLNHLKTRDKKA
jgi:hypothetical protein